MKTQTDAAPRQTKKAKKKPSIGQRVAKFFLRLLLVILTVVIMAAVALVLVCNTIFNGPSETARDVLTMSMLESSGMKWCPAVFIGEEKVAEIQRTVSAELPDDLSDTSQIQINSDTTLAGSTDEWADHPDGIRIEHISGDSYNAHVMIVRDPSAIYLATSNTPFSRDKMGARITDQIEKEGAIAAINAGAFWDDGTSNPLVGCVPEGLVISKGEVLWTTGNPPQYGFVGFNEDNILIVAKHMSASKARELNIRDGCCFGPVLIMNGEINEEAYNTNSGYNPRTAIGQRADGAIIMLCVDGRQTSSLGGSYADIIDIMVEYGAVNACNLDGGSSSVMLYRDYETGEVSMVNNYSLLQEKPRRMPTFFMVAPESEG